MGDVVSVEMNAPPTGVTPPVVPDASRPTWLPEKFKTPEELAKSYSELEKKFSQANQAKPADPAVPPAAVPGDKTPPPAPTELGTAEQAALTKAGLDINELEAEYIKNGKLSEESTKKLADAGIDQARMDAYQRGRQAQAEDFEKAVVKDIKGGKEALAKAMDWAGDSLTKSEIDAFNQTMTTGNAAAAALAAAGLVSRFNQAQGPQLIDGTPAGSRVDVYESRAQIQADMGDPRYKNDPAFRERVMAKSIRSNPQH